MFRILLLFTLLGPLAPLRGQDLRPAFDKSAYRNTLWTQANPWFPPNMSRVYRAGGPDYAMRRYSANAVDMWAEVARECQSRGLDGIQMEVMIHVPPDVGTLKNMLAGFEKAGNGFMLQFMISPWGSGEQFAEFFDLMADEIANHPNLYRLDGRPVIALYQDRAVNSTPPGRWTEWFAPVEAKHGPMIFLVDVAFAEPGSLDELLNHVDGVTMYGNWSIEMQRDLFRHVIPLMREKFPHKILEAAVHAAYLPHFSHGGVRPRLLDKYLASWEMTIQAQPDSVVLTNFFDIYENSRMLPSYELEDVLFKIARIKMAELKGVRPPADDRPDFRIVNHTAAVVGGAVTGFDVLGFPANLVNKNFEVRLELTDPAGNLVHAFAPAVMTLDGVKVLRHDLDTLPFADQYALVPRLSWRQVDGGQGGSFTGMPTILVASMLPHKLFWSRGASNQLAMKSFDGWSLNGATPGGVAAYPADGVGVVLVESAQEAPWYYARRDTAGDHVRLMRNGLELASFAGRELNLALAQPLPHPGSGVDSYHLEFENRHGVRFATLPVYLSAGVRHGTAAVPTVRPDGSIRRVEIAAERVPFFHYPCDEFAGNLWRDRSGYDHHGNINATWDGGKLATTGYHYEHTGIPGPGSPDGDPAFRRDDDGRGFLRFGGEGFIAVMGGTAFPGAATWELEVRPAERGEQALLTTVNHQLDLTLDAEGFLTAIRSNPSGSGLVRLRSAAPLPLDCWSKIVVTYDLERLRLYVDGQLQGDAAILPDPGHAGLNAAYIAARAKFPHGCEVPRYRGDLRQVRLYGRNLSPDEWL